MATFSSIRTNNPVVKPNAADLCSIVGFTCIVGFLFDIATAAMPVVLRSAQWRMNLLQQMSDRSIILLFGLALLTLSYAGTRLWTKRIGLISLIVGVFFLLSCLAFIKDSLTLQTTTNSRVDSQAAELQTQIQKQSSDPEFQAQVTPDQLREATQLINGQAESYKQNVKTSTVRLGLAALGNLLVMGIAFISLGRYCMRARRA